MQRSWGSGAQFDLPDGTFMSSVLLLLEGWNNLGGAAQLEGLRSTH